MTNRGRVLPRKPEEGGVGSRGQAVTDCNQFHSDHKEADMKICIYMMKRYIFLTKMKYNVKKIN